MTVSPRPAWESTPFPLIPTPFGSKGTTAASHGAEATAHGMAHVHNMLLRSLNAIYLQAPSVSSKGTLSDKRDFLELATMWHGMLHHHHHVEEEFLFPQLEKIVGVPGMMEGNVEQHRAFETGLAKMEAWTKRVTPETFDGDELCGIIDEFAGPLTKHLGDEIGTLLALKKYDSAKIKKVWDEGGELAKSSADPHIMIPMIVGCYDVTYEGKATSEVALPFFMYWLNDWWFSRKHAACWRFLPCDSRGKPRSLVFQPKEVMA